VSFVERLAVAIDRHGHLCVGIDPHAELLRAWDLEDSADGARDLGLRTVEAASGRAGIVKPQVAFFERHGSAGYAALAEVLAAARAAGLLIVADAKRGDIDTSLQGYAEAWLGPRSDLSADAVTVTPYQSVANLEPVFAEARSAEAGVFVLAATSNPSATPLQSAVRHDGRTVAAAVVDEVAERGQGVVVGATVDLGSVGLSPQQLVGMPILAPGIGAQGARAADLPALFGPAAALVLAAASRSILGAGPEGIAAAVAAHAEEARW
jgi:orotidine-5'-phosphate decarboxylase